MHPALKNLANQLGIPLSSRTCSNDWMWNGQNLATHWGAGWPGETDDDPLAPLPDVWLAHELAHWAVAEECQRDLPEYGLGLVFVFMCQGGLPLEEQEWLSSGVVDEQESLIQECAADILGLHFCSTLGVPIPPAHRWENSRYSSLTDHQGQDFRDPSAPERVQPALRLLERKYPVAACWFRNSA